jgi:sortase A
VPDSEKAMAADGGALPLLALCLALLLATTLGVVAARQRWSAVLVWVVAAPLVIALSWVATDVVMRLLPNLI